LYIVPYYKSSPSSPLVNSKFWSNSKFLNANVSSLKSLDTRYFCVDDIHVHMYVGMYQRSLLLWRLDILIDWVTLWVHVVRFFCDCSIK
jgi:hypothetical protein